MTFHRSINYGSALQAFALYTKIKDLGYNVQIIDYYQKGIHDLYGLYRKGYSLRNAKDNLVRWVFKKVIKNQKKSFDDFICKNTELSNESYEYGQNLSDVSYNYDAIVCGSDQIWNPKASDFDNNYFLEFAPNTKKIAYAVSINSGSLADIENSGDVKKQLNKFESLSVREKSGCEKMMSFLEGKISIEHSLDPTLLYDKDFYKKYFSQEAIDYEFIFMYSVNWNSEVIKTALNISRKYNLPILTLYPTAHAPLAIFKHPKVKIYKDYVGPEAFLSLLDKAKYVVTNSFHGVAFSVNFHKQFIAVSKGKRDGEYIRDERICGLLEETGLMSAFSSVEDAVKIDLDTKYNYTISEQFLREERKRAETYLLSSI